MLTINSEDLKIKNKQLLFIKNKFKKSKNNRNYFFICLKNILLTNLYGF